MAVVGRLEAKCRRCFIDAVVKVVFSLLFRRLEDARHEDCDQHGGAGPGSRSFPLCLGRDQAEDCREKVSERSSML